MHIADISIQFAYGNALGVTLEGRFQTELRVREQESKVEALNSIITKQGVVIKHNSEMIDAQQTKNRSPLN